MKVHKKWRKRLIAIPGYPPIDIDCQCEQVKKCIEIALKCTIKDWQRRPNIGYIVDQLAETEKSTYDKANSMNEVHILGSRVRIRLTSFNLGVTCQQNYKNICQR